MKITKCRLCDCDKFESVLSFENMAITSMFPKYGEEVKTADINLVRCESCGLLQLIDIYDKDDFYNNEIYGYRSGINKSMVNHLNDIKALALSHVKLWQEDAILDIGSNDGTLLNLFGKVCRRVGIDPTIKKFSKYYDKGIEVVPEYFSKDKLSGKFRVITGLSMLYDIEDPVKFLAEVNDILEDDGIVILEQGYVMDMINKCSYDTICHEHSCYYGVKQLRILAKKTVFNIIDIKFNDINGGSVVIVLSKNKPEMEGIEDIDETYDLKQFVENIEARREELLQVLTSLSEEGKTVIGYGASTKGNVLLQYCGIRPDLVKCIVDINKDKWGRVTPKTNIHIVPEVVNADYMLVLIWHFKDYILEKEKEFIKNGGKLIFPLPKVEIV